MSTSTVCTNQASSRWDVVYAALLLALRESREADARRWHVELCAIEAEVAA